MSGRGGGGGGGRHSSWEDSVHSDTGFVLTTSDVLEHKGRASQCTNETLQNNLSVLFYKYS